jgi:hypothetical protein
MVNFLALKILGNGTSSFAPGADGGRDGLFEGEAPYPSEVDRWKGIWYIQSKYHEPHLSKDPQKWLIEQVKSEIELFESAASGRSWPNNWILATNVLPSGGVGKGSFDTIKSLLAKSTGNAVNFKIWDGQTLVNFLSSDPDVANYYGHFITPGHILTSLFEEMADSRISVEEIVHYLVATQFGEHTYTKLDQAGSSSDARPGVHDLFVDLPYTVNGLSQIGILAALTKSSSQCHKYSLRKKYPPKWGNWHHEICRARVSLIKAGPGQGKSTLSQYLCQISRAKLILEEDVAVLDSLRATAEGVKAAAINGGFWPIVSRIPIQVELKEYAHWHSKRDSSSNSSVLNYLAETIEKRVDGYVQAKTVKRALAKKSWVIVFDGLDEVPNDFKGKISEEIIYFLNDVCVSIDADVLAVCTSRPQGYAGQFNSLDGPVVTLDLLDIGRAMQCATPLLEYRRSRSEADKSIETLSLAADSASIKELMTTPLQAHIMAVIVRDGGRPPERRWQLFHGFYHTMRKRESMKNFQNPRINKLLLEEDRLLKSVHNRLGFVLHARAETSAGAQTTLKKDEFRELVSQVVTELDALDVKATVADVMEATTERLVLVSTPEDCDEVRFDIRQLQEFFAAEFLYSGIDTKELGARVQILGADSHWREVIHFLLSALIANQRAPDLAYCVYAMKRIDEGDESAMSPTYARKTAAAVSVIARLLVEGVLEQDQRDRNHVKSLLLSLGGMFNPSDLSSVRGISEGTRTRTWIVQNCLEIINLYSPEQYKGAIYLLGLISPGAEHTTNMVEKFMALPQVSKNYLLAAWAEQNVVGSEHPLRISDLGSSWLIEMAITVLAHSEWKLYPKSSITTLTKLISENIETAKSILKKMEISRNGILFLESHFLYTLPRPKRSIDNEEFGFVYIGDFEANWVNKELPAYILELDSMLQEDNAAGYFEFLFSVVNLIRFSNEENFKINLLKINNLGIDKIGVLPAFFAALIPLSSERVYEEDSVELNTLSYSEYVGLDVKGSLRPSYQHIYRIDNRSENEADWVKLSSAYPILAIDFLFSSKSLGLKVFWPKELIAAIKSFPDALIKNILNWGVLETHSKELLDDVIEISKKAVVKYPVVAWSNLGQTHPFHICMDRHSSLLPIFTPALLAWIDNNARYQFIYNDFSADHIVKSFGLAKKELLDIALDLRITKVERAGALSIYWILTSVEHSDDLPLCDAIDIYKNLREEVSFVWLTRSLFMGVLIYHLPNNPAISSLVGELMSSCDHIEKLHQTIAPFIKIWQEQSLTPVTNNGLVHQWLNYSFEPPIF